LFKKISGSLCYSPAEPESNYRCTSRSSPECTQSYETCTDPNILCPPLINSFDPFGTRCNCLTNPQCSICVTNPTSSVTPVTLKCVATVGYTDPCTSVVSNCNDPTIICPTRLTCSDCGATSGCVWCNSGNIGLSSECVAGSTCSSPFVVGTGCSDTCYQNTNCQTCQTAGCTWCNNTDFAKSACVKYCDTATSNQKVVSTCSSDDPCNNHPTCTECLTNSSCTWCEGIGRSDGSNPGRYCSSAANCLNLAGCGVFNPCVAVVYKNLSTCPTPTSNFCSQFTNCLTCQGQTDVARKCYWCDQNGSRYCDSTCMVGNTVKVTNCAVFGATTGGLAVGTTGQTGSLATGSTGNSPSGFVPPPGTTPATSGNPTSTGPPTAPVPPTTPVPTTPVPPTSTGSPTSTGPPTAPVPTAPVPPTAPAPPSSAVVHGFFWPLFGIIAVILFLVTL